MTEQKETARCPVCGEMHELIYFDLNGRNVRLIPCPKVDRDTPMFFPEPKKNEGE
jgi:hypothetical protein